MITPLSQRDSAWKSIKLGFSTTTTIGSHGCTITCVSMLAGITPKETNERLKSVSGYANTNLIIWSKIKEAIPWLEFVWRGYTYENAKVADAIKQWGGCLVEVDGTPIGGSRHWVLYIGNQKMIDPWDGKEKPTSSYKAIGYATIKAGEKPTMMYKGYDLTNQDSMKVAVDVLVDVVKNNIYYKQADVHARYEVASLDELDAKIGGYKSRISDLTKQLGTAQAEVKNKEEIISNKDIEIANFQSDIKVWIDRLEEAAHRIEQLGKEKGNLAIEVEQLKIQIETLKQQNTEGKVTITLGELFKLLWNQKITISK